MDALAEDHVIAACVRTLRESGVDAMVVNAGGDLRVAGAAARRVRLRDPRAPASSARSLYLENASLATSADYFSRRWDGARYVSTLIDPRSAEPFAAAGSVSVRAADCMTADALTKVVMFASPALAEQVLASCDAQAYVQLSG
jgi:thiamine biosynthesis lipoprotein